MKALLDYVNTVMDSRQEKKVLHKMMDIIMIVFFAMLANADDWVEKVFHKQPAIRDRRSSAGSEGALDGGELPLATGCKIPGGWEPYVRETGSLSLKHYKEAVIEYIKTDRSGKQKLKLEEETVYNWNESRKTFGADHKSVNF